MLFWAIYLLEPFVRRYWPQTLVSWTTVLSARVRDPIVGRDVLFGVLLGVVIALLVSGDRGLAGTSVGGADSLLLGGRAPRPARSSYHAGAYAMRTAILFFFLLFLFRALLRNQWAAAAASRLFAAQRWTAPAMFDGQQRLYFSMFAVAVMHGA